MLPERGLSRCPFSRIFREVLCRARKSNSQSRLDFLRAHLPVLSAAVRCYCEELLPDSHHKGTDLQPTLGAVVDCETTGLTDNDEIIELAIILFEYDADSGAISSLVNRYAGLREPKVPCSEGAFEVHRISPEILCGKSLNKQHIIEILSDAQLIFAHNADFDRRFLKRLYPDIPDKKWACTMKHIVWDWEGVYRLGLDVIASHYNIERPVAHRAYADAMTVLSILRRKNRDSIPHLKQLHDRAHRSKLAVHLRYSPDGIPIQVMPIEQDDELMVRNGDSLQLVLWTKPHLDFINAYLSGTPHGSGRALRFDKVTTPRLACLLSGDYDVTLNMLDSHASNITFSVVTRISDNYSNEALDKYHALRKENVILMQAARAMEKTDLIRATSLYQEALQKMSQYADMQLFQGKSQFLNEQERRANGISGHIEIIDRLTLCLSRLRRGEEAYVAAIEYFGLYKKDLNSTTANRILKRVSKYR